MNTRTLITMYRAYRAVRRFAGRIETDVEDDDSEGDDA